MKSVCVFCASAIGARPEYAAAARAIATAVARGGMTLVYGGGSFGLMGALADAGIAANGRIVGVIPQALVDKELAHKGLADQQIVATMHERKARMAELS